DDNCLRYIGVKISGITVSPSPEWLQQRLRSIGVAPINNIVDVTNYVMRELGTPLHAFDAKKVGNKIVVRSANQNETLITLDKIQRTFKGGELVICDENSPVCIAGVLGGFDSGVSQDTTDIILESAVFDMTSVRKTARLHGINSDASFRFERGVDRTLTELATLRACQMIVELSGGTITTSLVDQSKVAFSQNKISFSPEEINSILGTNISDADIEGILSSLDFEITKENNLWTAAVPLYRIDVERTCDIAEEVLRIYGFNNVGISDSMKISIPKIGINDCRKRISSFLVNQGFFEAMNNSMISSSVRTFFTTQDNSNLNDIAVLNPLSKELDVMRFSLLPGLLENLKHNQNRQNTNLRLFEFGKTYSKLNNEYCERNLISGIVTGNKMEENWINSKSEVDFYYLKGIIENILSQLSPENRSITNSPYRSNSSVGLMYIINGRTIGQIGIMDNSILNHYSIKKPVYYFEFDIDELNQLFNNNTLNSKELPKTFYLRRDISIIIKNSVTFEEIKNTSFGVENRILINVNLFDVYKDKNIPEGYKSYSISYLFQHEEKTLTDNYVDSIISKIMNSLEKTFDAKRR
ncbi:MAG: phenylalanine--tRNA ligase subunit beta, partial [Crocinitomicaceae bacterium]